ncbi:bifunctional glutamate N-acetyltransferase/amino-acid acetyltransferase ArgJ [Phytomonospora endophytica]|uniref:Arginine biosynthesis bifunctional protein ArgJ n=1 Tax=Phytomonospora endophytica TaxID=714109 RepID=A0A841G0W5_9ACTN|nr:bifunctional glutamate N-acetyltransferase/amino-acid acetyltransferase ArgJ [Phytomonospora endophytica]MBB6039412.1 glutamate N-acetyltransferase/amino-acid N-acetyltransferase [Phytomonospora endophytica]GIG70139.1 arginine biosynthesis bifunctional protein ArgJ [Phytomonospora endophytica]
MTITTPAGFRAAGIAAGIKASGNKDLALVVNDGPARVAAGVFTANRVHAAPVKWSRQVLTDGLLTAVVLNSGGANACTGPQGFQDTHATAEKVAEALGIGAVEVAVCSTGLIGEFLPMDAVLTGVERAAKELSNTGGADAAEAIMTTDTKPKNATHSGAGWSIGGMAKGAGMLAPGLATMLVVLTTDARITAELADEALREACRLSFDRLDSDGAMSTNDTVLLLSSGVSDVAPDAEAFTGALTAACRDLAGQLLSDAEGSTKDVAIEVVNAASEDDAVTVGRSVARNNLVKTALFGKDPNWGRILAAVGTTDAVFDADELDVAINGVWICRAGAAAEDRSLVDMEPREIAITIDLKAGDATATILTNDLSHAYVHENSAYSS